MADLGDGRFAIYSGDLNQDNTIDTTDRSLLSAELPLMHIGDYYLNDVTGDGIVDEDDYRILKNNSSMTVSVAHP